MKENLFGPEIIKSISFSEKEIFESIHHLHASEWFEVDTCYSIGNFYEVLGLPQPKYKFDLYPQAPGVIEANANNLPLGPESVKSLIFDPPFTAGENAAGEISGDNQIRFNARFKTMQDLYTWYRECIKEFSRVLHKKGILIVKCQDCTSGRYQYFTHCFIYTVAVEAGFYAKDLFVLLSKQRILSPIQKQQHARKYHCYYWVFEKKTTKVKLK